MKNLTTSEILKNLENQIQTLEKLSDEFEANSWCFMSHTPEETFWLMIADKTKFLANKLNEILIESGE